MAQASGLLFKYDPNFCFSMIVGSANIVANKLYKRHTDGTLIVATANFDGPLFYPLSVNDAGDPVSAALVGFCVVDVIASGAWTQGCALAAGAAGTAKAADGNDRVIGRAFNACDDGAVGTMIPPAGESVGVLADSLLVTSGNSGAMTAGAVTVADTAILTGDLVIFSRRTTGGTPGNVSITTFTSATSFVLTSTSNTETSTFDYVVLRPVA